MCKVVLKESVDNTGFIIYNHLFSKNSYKFTTSQLVNELQQDNLHLAHDRVQIELDGLGRSGGVNQNFRSYSICGR